MKHKFRLVTLISVLTVLLSACNSGQIENLPPQDTPVQTSNSVQSETPAPQTETLFPQKFMKEYDRVIFDAELVTGNQENGYVQTTAILQTVDTAKAYDTFMKDIPLNDTYEFEGENGTGKSTTYVGEAETVLSVKEASSNCSFSSKKLAPYVNAAFRIQEKYDDYNADKYSTSHDLDFASRQTVYNSLLETLENIGLHFDGKHTAYALDYQTLQNEEYAIDINGNEDTGNYKPEWSQEDDCYYFFMRQNYQGLPVYHVFADIFKEAIDENAPLQIIYSQSGIEYLNIEKLFQFSDDTKAVALADFGQIAQTVADKYNMLLSESTYKVENATLYYMVDVVGVKAPYHVSPVWIMDVEEQDQSGSSIKQEQMVIDGVTAKEVL